MFVVVYNELRQLAARKLRGERDDHTLSTTALVHEAWLELNKLNRIQWQNRGHFLAVAAQAMRRILIDYAVARRRQKRGGGQVVVSLDDGDAVINERQAKVVECRFYGGMSVEETAGALNVSPATVKREWAIARAWLNREMQP